MPPSHASVLATARDIYSVRTGTGFLKLYFPTSTRTLVEALPRPVRLPAPALARAARPGVLIALPFVPFQEQSLFDRKLARLRQLEAFMADFDHGDIDVADACDILEVTVGEEFESMRETDYDAYALQAIRAAEKLFREDARLIHPDRANGELTRQLQPRCEAAMKFLENVMQAIRKGFQGHIVPEVEDVKMLFGLSSRGSPKLIVTWEPSATLDTTIEVAITALAPQLQRTFPPEVDSCIFAYADAPALFKRDECSLVLFHTGVDGPQAEMTGSKKRCLCDVPEKIRFKAQKIDMKKENARLLAEKRRYELPIGAAPMDFAKRGRYATPTPPWRVGGATSGTRSASSGSWRRSSTW
jgi:hypothetical protein